MRILPNGTKPVRRPRGRPRAFDDAEALAAALGVFLRHGYEGTSVNELALAMKINKPSLYAAFGDKAHIYDRVVSQYAEQAKRSMIAALGSGETLGQAVRAFLSAAIDIYAPPRGQPLGCLIATTAATAAGADSGVRRTLLTFLDEVDSTLTMILQRRFGTELADAGIAPRTLARLIAATAHSLAIRARAGASRRSLLEIADDTVSLLPARDR